jgi:hypothetical protein
VLRKADSEGAIKDIEELTVKERILMKLIPMF